MPPCGHMMQVVNEDKTCYFNVIFYFEIILLIKSLSTVSPCVVRSLTARWPPRSGLCSPGSCEVHVTLAADCGVKRTSSRPGNNARDALTIYRGNVTIGRDIYWQRLINKLYCVKQRWGHLVWERFSPCCSLTPIVDCFYFFYSNDKVLLI